MLRAHWESEAARYACTAIRLQNSLQRNNAEFELQCGCERQRGSSACGCRGQDNSMGLRQKNQSHGGLGKIRGYRGEIRNSGLRTMSERVRRGSAMARMAESPLRLFHLGAHGVQVVARRYDREQQNQRAAEHTEEDERR